MKFTLVDSVLEQTEDRIRTVKAVSAAEEYLADHFPGFPILPGVFMLEAMVQAARRLLAGRTNDRLVLGEVRALRYGAMVHPGDTLIVEVQDVRPAEGGAFQCRGSATVRRAGEQISSDDTAVSGKFTMRPLRVRASATDAFAGATP